MRLVRAILCLSLLLPLSGCLVAAAAAGAAYGYIKYENNEAIRDFEAPLEGVWDAALDALEDRGYVIPGGVGRDLTDVQDDAEVEGDDYWLRVERHPGGISRVRVRIGTFETEENKRRAGLLIEAIEQRL